MGVHGEHVDLAERTAEFVKKHGFSRGLDADFFSTLSEGIRSRGEEELERAMSLAPKGGRFWYEDRQSFATYASHFGFEKLNDLFKRLKAEGLAEGSAAYFLYHLTIFPYKKAAEKAVFDGIALAKKAGVDLGGFAFPAYYCLRFGKGRRDEILEVLELAQRHGLKKIEHSELEAALHYYRKPSARGLVNAAFSKGKPELLDFKKGSEGFSRALAILDLGIDKVEQLVFEDASNNAHGRTQELMAARYHQLGIFGADKQLVQALAQNPLFVPEALKPRKTDFVGHLGLVDYASRVFGRDAVRSVTKFAGGKSESEFALALLKMRNARKLAGLLSAVPGDARHAAVRVINHHGPEFVAKAMEVARESKLDPRVFLQPIAQGLAVGGKQLVLLRPRALAEIAGPHHEQQLEFFHSQPALWQRKVTQAVRMYKQIYGHSIEQMLGHSGPLVSEGF